MRSPLDVVLSSDTGWPEMHVAGRVRDDYQQTTKSPGGYETITFSLREPISSDVLLDYQTVFVYDKRTAEQVHGGRLVIPGKSTDRSGDVWQIQAIGEGPAHMQDGTYPVVYVESQLDGWYQQHRTSASGTFGTGATPDGVAPTNDNAITLAVSGGTVASALMSAANYERISDCGMTLGGYGYRQFAGKADAGWKNESAVYGQDGTPATSTLASTSWATGAATIGPFVVTTDFTAGADVVSLRIRRTGAATNVADDISWGAFWNVFVVARRLLRDGTNESNAAHANSYVLASEVVADLLGRFLSRFDGANATIDATTHHFDQLAYIDGATPMQIMDDLLQLESDHTWHVWGVNPSTGLHSFEFTAWPTTVRYDVSVIDGFDSPAPTDDVFASVVVRYKDPKGRIKFTTRTQTVSGIQRGGFLDLADEPGSLANANRAGDQFLAQHATPPNQGTLRIARPILDRDTGRMVQPWEIRPGSLFRVRGVRPYVDSLNATGRDGVTVFRGVSAAYSDSDGACTVELDNFVDDETQAITQLVKRRRRRR